MRYKSIESTSSLPRRSSLASHVRGSFRDLIQLTRCADILASEISKGDSLESLKPQPRRSVEQSEEAGYAGGRNEREGERKYGVNHGAGTHAKSIEPGDRRSWPWHGINNPNHRIVRDPRLDLNDAIRGRARVRELGLINVRNAPAPRRVPLAIRGERIYSPRSRNIPSQPASLILCRAGNKPLIFRASVGLPASSRVCTTKYYVSQIGYEVRSDPHCRYAVDDGCIWTMYYICVID